MAYDQTVARQSSTDQSADSTCTINTMYESYVQSEYDASVIDLTNEVDSAQQLLDSYVVDNEIVSGYNGVISEIDIAKGDELYSSSGIFVVNDYDEVTVTVDVEEDNIASAGIGATAKVNIDAFPDTVFDATVTDIGDATYDDSTGITSYEVTVKFSGDLSEAYSGMTAWAKQV